MASKFQQELNADTNQRMYGTASPNTDHLEGKYQKLIRDFSDLEKTYNGITGLLMFVHSVKRRFAQKATALEVQADILHMHANDRKLYSLAGNAEDLSRLVSDYRVSKGVHRLSLPSNKPYIGHF